MTASPTRPRPRAVVFAYHDVGVRCLRVLLDAGVDVTTVVTHADSEDENIWFGSVAQVALEHRLHCVTTTDAHSPDLLAAVRKTQPDFLFSFYYRNMLKREWLDMPTRGAFNMHGSLLPAYRGRAPVNWALVHGARETGATLHRMNEKPDNGAIVDQCAVPILGDDTAHDVFAKVVVAAEITLARALPQLLAGTAIERPQDLSLGGYYGGRKPEDGRIPVNASAEQIHNLVRALVPPYYPGAFFELKGERVVVERTLRVAPLSGRPGPGAWLHSDGAALWLVAADGGTLRVLGAHRKSDDSVLDAEVFEQLLSEGFFSSRWMPLGV